MLAIEVEVGELLGVACAAAVTELEDEAAVGDANEESRSASDIDVTAAAVAGSDTALSTAVAEGAPLGE